MPTRASRLAGGAASPMSPIVALSRALINSGLDTTSEDFIAGGGITCGTIGSTANACPMVTRWGPLFQAVLSSS